MFLTTEPSVPGRTYMVLRVVVGVGSVTERSSSDFKSSHAWRSAIGQALAELEREGLQVNADAVIAIQLSTSETGAYFHATAIGTAVKF